MAEDTEALIKESRKKRKESAWAKAFEAGKLADDEAAAARKAAKPAGETKKKARGKAAKPAGDTEAQPKTKKPAPGPASASADRSRRANYGAEAGVIAARQLHEAFVFFNRGLFEGKLPPALVRYQVEKKANGIFSPDRFARARGEDRLDEICVNPTLVDGRTDRDILSTLVHEMVHLKQEAFGKAPRKAFHNAQWCEYMRRVGLEPIIVDGKGNPTGKEKGKNARHEILEGGPFDESCAKLLETGFTLEWLRLPDPPKAPSNPKPKTTCKHVCPSCDEKATAKISAKLTCGACEEPMIPEIDPETEAD